MTVEEIQQLKDLFQDVVCAKVASLEKLMNEKFEANTTAVQLQAREYERRLEFLNGEATRLREMQVTYVPREVQEKVDSGFCKDINELKTYRDTQIGKSLAISAATSGGIAAVIGLAFKFLGG